MARVRRWTFTLNNPDDEHPHEDCKPFRYLVYQLEKGDNGTPHYQGNYPLKSLHLAVGYIEFTSSKRFSAVKSLLPRAHWEPAGGDQAANKHYCSKPVAGCSCKHCDGAIRLDGPWEYGEPAPDPKNSRRTDLLNLRNAIRDGKSHRDIMDDDDLAPTALLYPKATELLLKARTRIRDTPPEVHLLHGPPGCGKTSFVYEHAEDLWKQSPGASKWFDGYMDHEDALFDEFEGKFSKTELSFFNQVIDR